MCEYCGNAFEGDAAKTYCSIECISKACKFELDTRKCKTCGEEFETLTDAIYCSFDCAYNLHEGIDVTLP